MKISLEVQKYFYSLQLFDNSKIDQKHKKLIKFCEDIFNDFRGEIEYDYSVSFFSIFPSLSSVKLQYLTTFNRSKVDFIIGISEASKYKNTKLILDIDLKQFEELDDILNDIYGGVIFSLYIPESDIKERYEVLSSAFYKFPSFFLCKKGEYIAKEISTYSSSSFDDALERACSFDSTESFTFVVTGSFETLRKCIK